MKEIIKITNNTTEVIARINCSDFELELLDSYLVKLAKIETKSYKLVDRDIEVRYVIKDINCLEFNDIRLKLKNAINSNIKEYNDKIDLINVLTKRTNKKLGRPINEGLLKHYEL